MPLFGSKSFDKAFPLENEEQDRLRMQEQAARAAQFLGAQIGQGEQPTQALPAEAQRNSFDGLPVAAAPRRNQRAPWDDGGGWAERLGDFGQSLMAAQASIDGNFGAANSIMDGQRKRQVDLRRRLGIGNAMRQQGYSDGQIMMALSDPESVGKNFNERLGTRVVAPGSSVVTGGPNGQQATYSQPNGFEAYAAAQGYAPGTAEYGNAVQDYALRQYGPTGLANQQALDDHRTGNKVKFEGAQQSGRSALEAQRQQGRLGLEGARQQNRITTRGTPTYRDLNPPAPRASAAPGRAATGPTATGPNGQKLQWNGKAWVPVR